MHLTEHHAHKVIQAITDRFLELIILPTKKYNFRCTYCYEDFAIGKMKPEIIQGIKNLIDHRVREHLQQLRISWFGGEPLLAKDVVLNISQFIMDKIKENPSLKYYGTMTANGYRLDQATFSSLINLGINDYQISLDGTPEAHDTTRLRADGQGTFDTIWANLVNAKKTSLKFKITLRLHVTPNNMPTLPKLIQMIKKEFSNDDRFQLFLNDDRNDIGHITPEGYLKLKNEKSMPWIRGLSTFDLKSLACPLMELPKALLENKSAG